MSARDRGDRVMGKGAAAAAGVAVVVMGASGAVAGNTCAVVGGVGSTSIVASSDLCSSTAVTCSPDGGAASNAASPGDVACGPAEVAGKVEDGSDAGGTASAMGCAGTLLTEATNPPSLAFSTLKVTACKNHVR